MAPRPDTLSLQTAERLVDALNRAIDLDAGPISRVEFLLQRVQALLERKTRVALWVLEDLERKPAPLITSRTVVIPEHDDGSVADLRRAQQALEDIMPVSHKQIIRVLQQARTPATLILSREGDAAWFESVVVQPYFAPLGYVDCMTSMWAASSERAMLLICLRREADPPFSDADMTVFSLAMRAVAPLVDRDLFRMGTLLQQESLSEREREILFRLLAGDSEKEIAQNLSRSPHTVHTFVQRIYRSFNVSSRGALMSLFVDRTITAALQEGLQADATTATA